MQLWQVCLGEHDTTYPSPTSLLTHGRVFDVNSWSQDSHPKLNSNAVTHEDDCWTAYSSYFTSPHRSFNPRHFPLKSTLTVVLPHTLLLVERTDELYRQLLTARLATGVTRYGVMVSTSDW